MNRSFVVLFCSFFMFATGLPAGNAIRHYYEAQKSEKAGQSKRAWELYEMCAKEAAGEGLPQYVFLANYHAAFSAFLLNRFSDCIEHANACLKVLDERKSSPWAGTFLAKYNRVEMLGLAEKSSLILRKNGQGWRYNHLAIEAFCEAAGMPVSPGGLDPKRVASLPRQFRPLGWRLIGREANYLHLVGRTAEARALLAEATAMAPESVNLEDRNQSLYVTQLFNQLGMIESFVGYKKRAIEIYKKEIELIETGKPMHLHSLLTARMNLLSVETELNGVTEESVRRARRIQEQARRLNPRSALSMERLLVKMEAEFKERKEIVAQLERLSERNKEIEDFVESFYAERNALFGRAGAGEDGLDPRFNQLLEDVRKKGDKRAEPRIYRHYGDWLALRGRYGEALSVYREALRMTRQFGWHPGVPLLQAKIGAVLLADGQAEHAEEAWREMDRYVAEHPDIPALAILRAWNEKMMILLEAGHTEEALLLAGKARSLGASEKVADKWLFSFKEDLLARYIDYLEKTDSAQNGEPGAQPGESPSKARESLQPVGMTTMALAGNRASASFYLVNHGGTPVEGGITVKGPGVSLSQESEDGAPVFSGNPSKPESTAVAPVSLPAGVLLEIPIKLPPHAETSASFDFEIAWSSQSGDGARAAWSVSWGADAAESVVLDAARLELSPFVGVPVLHHVGFPDDGAAPKALRLRSAVPVRIEYRDPKTDDLIAVDANGNGIFTDEGDVFPPSAQDDGAPAGPRVGPVAGTRTGSLEIWIYPHPDHPWKKKLEIPVELWNPESGWTEFATDVVEAKSR